MKAGKTINNRTFDFLFCSLFEYATSIINEIIRNIIGTMIAEKKLELKSISSIKES
ncbi:MAG: hypothetical protein KJ971_07305 [Firmicutes bacterium]|nr:hypothetical protein [Bacillota bacterium]